jgi:translation initiation factor 1 (eIF-1/SUI1)
MLQQKKIKKNKYKLIHIKRTRTRNRKFISVESGEHNIDFSLYDFVLVFI